MILTREQAEKRRERGIGTGEGSDYVPWLAAREVPSRGRTTVVWGWKTRRSHTLLSGLERRAFFLLQRQPDVLDIREQYPLWPPERTREVARSLGVRHPGGNKPGCFVVTVDLLATRRGTDGPDFVEALSVKPQRRLDDARTQEKLTVELESCKGKGVRWFLLTEEELDTPYARNVEWMDEHHEIADAEITPEAVARAERWLRNEFDRGGAGPLNGVCAAADRALGFSPGTALTIFRHLLSRRRLLVPLGAAIDLWKPIPRPCVFTRP